MLIHEMTLENFGLYRGQHVIPLAPKVKYRHQRPVVLIGGQNGAGKSTILEALRLCLYGPLSLGERVSQREYEELLRERVHRTRGEKARLNSASVGLSFEHSAFGELHTYSVERSWELAGAKTVHTFLEIKRDGEPLDEVDQAAADEFLRGLIPPGVSQLYFFDGEKIQELAEADDDSGTLGDAIKGLLGLDLVDQLSVDLKVYSRRLDDVPETAPIKERLDELSAQKKQMNDRGDMLHNAADKAQAELDKIKQEVSHTRERLAREGSSYAKKEADLHAEQEVLLASVKETEDELRDLCGRLLPFSLAEGLCDDLAKQLKAEYQIQSWHAHSRVLAERLTSISETIDGQLFDSIKLKADSKEKIRGRVEDLIKSMAVRPDELSDVELIHKLSDDDRERLLSEIDHVKNQLPERVKHLESRLEELTRRLTKVGDQLRKIPAEDQLEPILQRLDELVSMSIDAEKACDAAFAEWDKHQSDVVLLDREATKLDKDLSEASTGMDRRAMVNSVQKVLQEYSMKLGQSKAMELTGAVEARFIQLWRKDHAIKRVEIQPETYGVTLFDAEDRVVSKKQLSAGEKQVYAVSMLWALAEVSGRPLPVVIDTPLGRLDSQHRSHLVEHYFPNASHQVIILSTDTEIDEEHFRELSPCISHALNLTFDDEEGCTSVEEGYFWGRRRQEASHANQ